MRRDRCVRTVGIELCQLATDVVKPSNTSPVALGAGEVSGGVNSEDRSRDLADHVVLSVGSLHIGVAVISDAIRVKEVADDLAGVVDADGPGELPDPARIESGVFAPGIQESVRIPDESVMVPTTAPPVFTAFGKVPFVVAGGIQLGHFETLPTRLSAISRQKPPGKVEWLPLMLASFACANL